MQYSTLIYYPLLAALIIGGAKYFKKGSWNEDFLSPAQTKFLQGFCAVCVLLHHIGQKTCAPWLPSKEIIHGLDIFVPIGYLFVSVFLFFSGFGLYKSLQSKPDYLQGFWGRRYLMPLFTLFFTNIAMICVRTHLGEKISFPNPFHLNGPIMFNGYAWFVYSLLIFYTFFYFAYKYCKSEKTATIFVLIGIVAYILFCDWWMYGNWWYNSALLFGMGILFARREQDLIQNMRKHYDLYLPITLITACLFFFLGEHTGYILFQMVAAHAFVFLLLLLGMKIKIGNKVLGFLGNMTLEFYMLHGIFLQYFGYNEAVTNPAQIKNVTLLLLVVLLSTLCTAYPLHKLFSALTAYIRKNNELTALLKKDFKRFLKCASVFLIALTLYYTYTHHHIKQSRKELIDNYIKENINFANVDGGKMSAYVTGEGEHTIVFLRGLDDPCPSITLSPVADALATRNKVIILDYFGCGFSDSTKKERTAENFVYEIRTALQDLGVQGPYIFAAHEISGLYAQLYAQNHREEVEAIVGFDSAVAAQPQDLLRETNITPKTYKEQLKKQSLLNLAFRESLYITGYGRTVWPLYKGGIQVKLSNQEYLILEEQFAENYYNENSMKELALRYDNHQSLLPYKYPEDLPVLFILSDYAQNGPLYPGSDWIKLHEDLCTNPTIQSILYIDANPYFVYYNPDYTAETIQKFIDSLDTRE